MKNWKMLILLFGPWLTFFVLGKQSFKKYLPTSVFSSLLIAIISEFAKSYKWWKVKTPLVPKLATDLTFVFGLFLPLNQWIFKLTYQKLWLYVVSNIVSDYLFAYPLTTLAEKFNIYKMKNMSRMQLFFLSLFVAFLNYLYQRFIIDSLPTNRKEKSLV
ncbi:hypothetical protein [Bacillus sp. B1-b2]|uniref:hypothetical protein n=1 Tax=Bacillus sp. B1-b2 TaxID=2653201 RepID=UPI001261FAAD|nr:hypothetical protein [Bacillus sp. B1-b2]KAB7665116.1 hypothetical protein F9279_21350 [Bacillus sp. B1-b2]